MFRYIYPLDKDALKILRQYDEYLHNKNPKDKDLIFERRVENGKFEKIDKPNFNMNVFNYNYQKYYVIKYYFYGRFGGDFLNGDI